ncbi:amino acid ABC transporter permease [Paracoccus sp. XHP0099]|uniref:Amino acid ABC transporter permease n=1 Tax=Paracoccus marinaquae TaxID=2841926 RepID=A0ABS6ANR9_9RHOB|nr:amino acid ABC transporter permease [Paracoccus marinaquae]
MEQLTIAPLRHPWRNVAVAIVLVLVLALLYSVATNPEFQWPVVGRYLFDPLILRGVVMTLVLTAIIMVLACVGGTLVALMLISPSRLLSVPANLFVWFFRGMPALVQLIFWYNMALLFKQIGLFIPFYGMVFSIPTNDIITPFVAAVIALSLQESGYMAEIVRNGLKSVGRGQTEAALCLGMKPSLLMRRIVLPQSMRVIIPPTGNEMINLLKTTSLVSTIAVGDLLYSAQSIYARTFETIPLLLVASAWYLAIVSVTTVGQSYLEFHFSRDEAKAKPSLLNSIASQLFSFRRRSRS